MANNIQQIRNANKEYYCDTYLKKITRSGLIYKLFIISATGVLLFFIKQVCLRLMYYKEAGQTIIVDSEVSKWVHRNVIDSRFDMLLLVIMVFTIIMLMGELILYKKVKSYELYKYSNAVIWIPVGIVLVEIGIFLYLIFDKGAFSFSVVINILLQLLPYLVSVRTLEPLEVKELPHKKKKFKIFWTIFDGIANKIIDNL